MVFSKKIHKQSNTKLLLSFPKISRQRQGRRQKIFQEGGATEKIPKIIKKYRKIAQFSLFQRGWATEKRPKNSKKRPKNSTFKPLFTIFAPCLKIQGGQGCSPPPTPMDRGVLV